MILPSITPDIRLPPMSTSACPMGSSGVAVALAIGFPNSARPDEIEQPTASLTGGEMLLAGSAKTSRV